SLLKYSGGGGELQFRIRTQGIYPTAPRPKQPRRGGKKAAAPFSAWILHLDINNLTALTAVYGSPYGQGPQKTQCLCGSLRVYGSGDPWRCLAVPVGHPLALNQTKSK